LRHPHGKQPLRTRGMAQFEKHLQVRSGSLKAVCAILKA
jgi:hypothetical protein